MSVFDPNGLISPLITPAKRIMQDTCDLGTTRIHRCYYATPAARYELHTFVDVSEKVYAAAVYWRMECPDGSVHVALAAGKSRVTPTTPVSIPRLELQAAVQGVRLARTVLEEHDYAAQRKVYWSNSRTALAWIRAEPDIQNLCGIPSGGN